MNNIVCARNITKFYNNKKVVDDVSISITKGEVFGLLGANGAGKSTTIECILGTKIPDEGEISILGLNVQKNRKAIFEQVGVQFQDSNYQDQIKVEELCQEICSLYQDPMDYHELLNQFKLTHLKKRLVKELSGGEKQRLFIVVALIANPKIVFLDELTTGLDARNRRDVWQYLEKLKKQGLSIFLTSHFMDEVERLCDRIMILKKGKVVYQGDIQGAIQNSPYQTLEEAYLWYTEEDQNSEKL